MWKSLGLLFEIAVIVHEKSKLGWHLILFVIFVAEENSPDPTIGVNLNPLAFDIFGSICLIDKIRHIKINDIPPIFQSQWHSRYECFDLGHRIKIGAANPSSNHYAVDYLHFKGEMPFQILDNQNYEWIFYAQRFFSIRGCAEITAGQVRS